jgi:adenine-specific DNA-methyltransferase
MPGLDLLTRLDAEAVRLLADLRWGPLTAAMALLSAWWVKGVAIAAAGAVADLRRRPRALPWTPVLATAALLAASLAASLLKDATGRARPPLGEAGVTALVPLPADASMPSGHAATAAAAATAVALLHPRLRAPLAALVAAIALSRVYLGVHHPSDVLAGAALGAAVGWLVAAAARRAVRGPREDGPVIKYIGSKRALAPVIERVARRLPIRSAADLFAGTTRAGQAFRRAGCRVVSNDLATYSEALGQAYIAAGDDLDRDRLRAHLRALDALPGAPGYATRTFCEQARFFSPDNGARIDAIRDAIDRIDAPEPLRGCLLTSLLEAADRVDSTCGLQMAYLKRPAPRSLRPLELREPAPVDGPPGAVVRRDANALARDLDGVDCAYLDPPYNGHSYFSNYHVWETLCRWDRPEAYGVARKRLDCRTTHSPYNRSREAWGALSDLVEALPTPWVVASVSDEGFHAPADVAALLAERGHVASLAVDQPRYVGARIGIHNPAGERVGTVSHVRTLEYVIVSGPDRAVVESVFDEGAGARAALRAGPPPRRR